MRVLAVSVAPLFPAAVHGGSQRILMAVLQALGEAGHEVRVLCSRRPENEGGFRPFPCTAVESSLLLRGAFPSPYEVAPYRLAQTARALRDAAEWAERIYLHADAVFMRHLLGEKPVIRSFHDFIYEEALLSAFSLPAERTIVPSEYIKQCIETAVGTAGARGLEEVTVIANGVAVPARRPAPRPPQGIGTRKPGDIVLLYPHRPDLRKGIRESLQAAAELARRRSGSTVRVLVAMHVDDGAPGERTGYRRAVTKMAKESGLEKAVGFFEWVPAERMPSLYAFADATLCLGNFIEAFGLVPLESAAAGTPAVCARVGALRDLEGMPGLHFVPYGDTGAATDAIEAALSTKLDLGAVTDVISNRFSLTRMQQGYVKAITGPLHKPETRSGPAPARGGRSARYRLAPWCHIEAGRIYNDYEYGYADLPALVKLLTWGAPLAKSFTFQEAVKAGVPESGFVTASAQGIIVRA